jgi:hypothetical protein
MSARRSGGSLTPRRARALAIALAVTSIGVTEAVRAAGDAAGSAAAAPASTGMPPTTTASPAPTAERPANAAILFDGKDLSQFKQENGQPATWKIIDGGAVEVGPGDLVTSQKFAGDFVLHVEFMTPAMPNATGQAKGNSGVYLADCFELQVLDSFGLAEIGLGDCGAIYGKQAPTKNAARPPGQWQTFEAHYQAPRWDAAGTKTKPARLTLWWNGEMVHDNIELDGPCPGAKPESPQGGPIRLQDHGNPVRFRNIWLAPMPVAKG